MTMQLVDATPLKTGSTLGSLVDMVHLNFEIGRLVVTLNFEVGKKTTTVKFEDVVGFRVLDEGDLLEYWPACSSDNGWLFLINGNGWFEQETIRSGFLHERGGVVTEYFVATQNCCVSVLAGSPPTVDEARYEGLTMAR